MTTSYTWLCGCGVEGQGETAAKSHAAVCSEMGYPWCQPSWPRPDGADVDAETEPKWTDLYGMDPAYIGGRDINEWLSERRGDK